MHERTILVFNYVDFQDLKKAKRQEVALQVLSLAPKFVEPCIVSFEQCEFNLRKYGFSNFKIIESNVRQNGITNRNLCYIKELLNIACLYDSIKIGYINSDILLNNLFFDAVQMNFDALICSRYEVKDVTANDFLKNNIKYIWGGDKHVGADGFVFDSKWWNKNKTKFPDQLIIGEPEWDTCYRHIIKKNTCNFLEKRCLFHVYHDQTWSNRSKGAQHNISIWNSIK